MIYEENQKGMSERGSFYVLRVYRIAKTMSQTLPHGTSTRGEPQSLTLWGKKERFSCVVGLRLSKLKNSEKM